MSTYSASRLRWRLAGCLVLALLASAALAWNAGSTESVGSAASTGSTGSTGSTAVAASPATSMDEIVPAPVRARPAPGNAYAITADTRIYTEASSREAAEVGRYLAGILRPSTGYSLPVREADRAGPPRGIMLLLSGAPARVGDEGYRMNVTKKAVRIHANEPAGLIAGVQTLRQLLPPSIEADTTQSDSWVVPGGHVMDYPRFDYRAAMLDVARHFFAVDQVKSYIDQLAMYKINYLHLHLTDDQGWRLMIDSWPRLATYGGSTEVGGGEGGYYTKAQYREIVSYAQERGITIVPEIDMPGHTNAALASYAELNCDGEAPDLYTGIEVGFSSLCIDKEITYEFVEDVVREVAAMTPGPYLHIGGDEAHETSPEDYASFMQRAQGIVRDHGKIPRGWHQIVGSEMPDATEVQYWGTTGDAPDVATAAKEGHDIVLSPASHAYLDMKYDEDTELGLTWAGFTPVRDAYSWDPGAYLDGVDESAVLGVEAPLWTETIENSDDIEFMAFPRVAAVAELGWSPAWTRGWDDFRQRLAAQGPRWDVLDVNYYRSPQVPWPDS